MSELGVFDFYFVLTLHAHGNLSVKEYQALFGVTPAPAPFHLHLYTQERTRPHHWTFSDAVFQGEKVQFSMTQEETRGRPRPATVWNEAMYFEEPKDALYAAKNLTKLGGLPWTPARITYGLNVSSYLADKRKNGKRGKA